MRNEAKYEEVARAEETEITKQRARETVELLRVQEFAPCGFKLDCMRAPVLKPDVADAVGLRYGRLSMRAKIKFHIDQMTVELERLRLLVSQGCRRIHETEVEIKYVESLEVQRANEARILKAVRTQQRDLDYQLRRRQTAVEDPVVIPDDSDESVADGMVGLGADDQELVIPSVEHIGDRQPANLEGTKNAGEGISVAESGVGANEAGENKIGESMAIEDEAGGPDVVAAKSLEVPVGGSGGPYVAAKILEVPVGGSEGATKSAEIIVERWETPADSGIRVPMASNLNNPTLVPLPLASSRLGMGKGMSSPASPVALRRPLGPLSSLGRTTKTISGPQGPLRGQKVHRATSESSARPFDNTQDITLYEKFLTAEDDEDL